VSGAAETVDRVGAKSAEHVASFQTARPRLFAVAYSVLGNGAERMTSWHRDDDQIVPWADAGLLSAELVRTGTAVCLFEVLTDGPVASD
jgi:hypothetical protein